MLYILNQSRLERVSRRYVSVGGGAAAPVDTPAVTPPTSESSPAVAATTTALKRQQLRRKTVSGTMRAGATGGWSPQAVGAQIPGNAAPGTITGGSSKTGG